MLTFFQDIKGQNKAKQILATAINNQKTSHAYLFKGPTGVGKKMTAHGFAALVNCANPDGTTVCGICPSCKKFNSNNHPDFHIIKPDGAGIKIKQIRALQKNLAFPPFEAKIRIILLPDIHDTLRRPEVANALLKTLEEPPEDTTLILTGDEADNILPTILSRCQTIPFTPLSVEEMAPLLKTDNMNNQQIITLAAVAEGSPGRARHQQQTEFLELRKTVINTLTHTGKNSSDTVTKVYAIAQQANDLKDDASELLDLLTSWLRDLIILNTEGQHSPHIINQDLENLNQSAAIWSTPALMNCLQAIETAQMQLQRNCTRTLVFEVLFFALLNEKW